MSSILIAISAIDYFHKIIPVNLIFAAFVGLLVNAVITRDFFQPVAGLVFGLAYLGGISLITSMVFKKKTMGVGDLFLITILGAWLGVIQVGLTIFLGSLFAVIGWSVVSWQKGVDRNRRLPFAPYLSFSAILCALLQWHPFNNLF